MPRHEGQGSPVPASLGVGVWVRRPVMWIDTTGDTPGHASFRGVGQGTSRRLKGSRLTPYRFGGAELAATLGVGLDQLVELNATAQLQVDDRVVAPRDPDGTAVRFRISWGEIYYEVTVERDERTASGAAPR